MAAGKTFGKATGRESGSPGSRGLLKRSCRGQVGERSLPPTGKQREQLNWWPKQPGTEHATTAISAQGCYIKSSGNHIN